MTQAEQNCRDRIIEWMDFYGISKDAKDRIIDIVDEYAVISESEGYRRGCRNCQRGFGRIGGGSWQGSGKDAKEI